MEGKESTPGNLGNRQRVKSVKPKGSSNPLVRYLTHIFAHGLVQGGQENGSQSIGPPNGKGPSQRKILHGRLT